MPPRIHGQRPSGYAALLHGQRPSGYAARQHGQRPSGYAARQHGQRPSGYAARQHGQRPSGYDNDRPLMQTAELSFVVILGVMAAFYFIFIRPARQEQKRLEETIRDLHVGDEVITTAGFFARITEIRTPEQGDVELVLDLGGGLEVRALTSSILRRIAGDEAATERAKEKAQGP